MRVALVPLLAAAFLHGQDTPYFNWVEARAKSLLGERRKALAAITTVAAAEQRQRQVRERVLELIGGLPNERPPLNPRISGRREFNGYTVENVIFDSLPNYPVTGNLYRPTAPGKYPAVLYAVGHWDQGKPSSQRISANLALKGFVVLTYDPPGQGERLQGFDPHLKRALAGGSTAQHFLNGAQSILSGETVARYFIWDGMRALDYLETRPEVDATRIGATGCSGGGTQSTYISALDPRVKVAAPACYINSFEKLINGPTGDSEQSFPGFLSSGLDQGDYLGIFAPKPWLIASTEGDFFTPAGARIVYEEAREWYRIWGVPERVKWVVGPGGHGTPLLVREAIYEWMIRWLKDGKGDAREHDVQLVPDFDLLATSTGQVATSVDGVDLYRIIEERAAKRRTPGTAAQLATRIRELTGAPRRASQDYRTVEESRDETLLRQRIEFETEPGLNVSAILLTPLASGRKTAVLIVDPRNIATLAAPGDTPLAAARAGHIVLLLRPRAIAGAPAHTDAFSGDWISNTRAWLIGRNLPGMRALDILHGADILLARPDVARLTAHASHTAGIWLLLAAALEPRIAAVWVDRTPHSLREAFTGPVHRDLHDAVIPGFTQQWDLAGLAALLAPRKLIWTDPTGWLRDTVRLQGPPYRYRYFEQPDMELIGDLVRP
ncbi:MAG: acetylxylan esterase [Acidobacteria bacterium]|nr:acetylxylan esterase [Acidobacteriota bacterium]